MANDCSDAVYGIHAVQAIAERQPHKIKTLYVKGNVHSHVLTHIITLAKTQHIPVQQVAESDLQQLAGKGSVHQGVVAKIKKESARTEQDLWALLDALDEPPLLLILDNIQDPRNLGACLRSADAAGAHAVIAPQNRSAGLTAATYKTACGATETVPFIAVTNLVRTMQTLQKRGIWLIGADAHGEETLYQMNMRLPTGIVMGSEGSGLRRLTKEHCDYLCCIPMAGTVSSLNVSVAAAIFLFEAVRQRINADH